MQNETENTKLCSRDMGEGEGDGIGWKYTLLNV